MSTPQKHRRRLPPQQNGTRKRMENLNIIATPKPKTISQNTA